MTIPPDLVALAGRPAHLVEAMSAAREMPDLTLARALLVPGAVAGPILAVVKRAAAGEKLDERAANLLFWGVHVLGAAQRTELYRPLLSLLRQGGDALDELLGPALAGTLPNLVIGSFDGDAEPLEAALLDPGTDEVARQSLFQALAYLAWTGAIERDRAQALLVRFDDERPVRAGDAGWDGWEVAIALLGLRDLAGRVHAAIADARVLDDGNAFDALLGISEAAPDDRTRFEEAGLGPIEDLVEELGGLLAMEEPDLDEEAEPIEPVRNPLRDVGRNDPCPCGSGKKFKKCCLAA